MYNCDKNIVFFLSALEFHYDIEFYKNIDIYCLDYF